MPMMMHSLTPLIASRLACAAASKRWSVVFSKEASLQRPSGSTGTQQRMHSGRSGDSGGGSSERSYGWKSARKRRCYTAREAVTSGVTRALRARKR